MDRTLAIHAEPNMAECNDHRAGHVAGQSVSVSVVITVVVLR